MRRRGIGLGILSAEGTFVWFHPAGAVVVALAGVGGMVLVVLIVVAAIVVGNSQTCEQVFRLLRLLADRPEPARTRTTERIHACEGGEGLATLPLTGGKAIPPNPLSSKTGNRPNSPGLLAAICQRWCGVAPRHDPDTGGDQEPEDRRHHLNEPCRAAFRHT